MKHFLLSALAILSTTIYSSGAAPAVRYQAGDTAAVRIVGRTDRSAADGSVRFDWSGVYAETQLNGRSLQLRAGSTGKSYFDVTIDGKHSDKILIASPDTLITIAEKLPRGIHNISIRKCTEGRTGMTTFSEFILPAGGTLTATLPRGRHIEIIGNSLSAGYGTDSNDPRAPFTAETENCNLAYSTIIPRYYDADYTIIAHSGQGAARNYGDSDRVSKTSMRHRFRQTLDMDTASRWHFGDYRPDLVMINLGSNDFSTEPHPYRREFVDAYCEIISDIQTHYGESTPILCVMPYAMGPDIEDFFKDIFQQAKANLHFIRMPVDYLNWDSDRGANWHPNYQGQKKMAMLIIPYIASITGWDFPTKAVE